MTPKEREETISFLALYENVSELVYKNHTDQQLQDRLEFLFGGDKDDKNN